MSTVATCHKSFMMNRMVLFFGLFLMSMGTSGCFLFQKQMKVPKTLQKDAKFLVVSMAENDTNFEKMNIGGYKVDGIARSWTGRIRPQWRSSINISQQKQYGFDLVEKSGDRWMVDCGVHAYKRFVTTDRIFSLGRKYLKGRLGCVLRDSHSDKVWTLQLYARGHQKSIVGSLTYAGERMDIIGKQNITDSKHKLLKMMGFYIKKGGKVVSMINLAGEPSLRLKSKMNQKMRTAIVGTSAALILFNDLRQQM